jgi:WD40 repeat protein
LAGGEVEPVDVWANQPVWVSNLAFVSNGETLVSADNAVRLWDFATGELLYDLDEFTERVTSVAISADGNLIAAGSNDGGLRIWQVSNGELVAELQDHGLRINGIAFSPDGQWLFTGSHDNAFRKWNIAEQRLEIERIAPTLVWSVAVSPDGSVVAVGWADGTLQLIDTETDEVLRVVQEHEWIIRTLLFTPDGKTLITGAYDNTIRLWGVPD